MYFLFLKKYLKILFVISIFLILTLFFIFKYLAYSSSSDMVKQFYSLNVSAIESNNAYELIPVLNSISINPSIISITAIKNNKVFFSHGAQKKVNSIFNFNRDIVSLNKAILIQFYFGLTNENYFFMILIWIILMTILLIQIISMEKISEIQNLNSKNLTILAKQVAHDIRSPLSALNMVAVTLDQIPEERRLLIRNSIQRINDIANSLLQKSKANELNSELDSKKTIQQELKLKTELLPALIDTIISEKRMQFRNQINVSIDSDLTNSYGTFAKVDGTELKRVISNLINNSVEAFFNQTGKVLVTIKKENDSSLIVISDNGKGIPNSILEKLGQEGITHGKEGSQSGSGLGIFHAKKTIEIFSGTLNIESKENKGTIITIKLPKAKTPDWFVEKLIIPVGKKIISVDDDLSIHGIWKGRAQSLGVGSSGIEHLSFTSGEEFKKWFHGERICNSKSEQNKDQIYLIDYEFLHQHQTGLDLIEELNLGANSILITSRYEEEKIRERSQRLGVKLIPKTMAGFVPIEVEQTKIQYDWILIDDDPLVHMTWDMAAKEKGIQFKGYKDHKDFLKDSTRLDQNTPIYIDSNLGQNIKGEEVAKEIFDLGFNNLYLVTGYDPENFIDLSYIKAVLGKEPPHLL